MMNIDPVVLDDWYPVALVADVDPGKRYRSTLLGYDIEFGHDEKNVFSARRLDSSEQPCRVKTSYCTHWVSLGNPHEHWFDLPELDESDRRILSLGSLQIHVSGLRVIENFLDMAHFPFVHGGILGETPYTDVNSYRVRIDASKDELLAEDCIFYQPVASAAATGGIHAEYTYRVVRPLSAILYKSSGSDLTRRDLICLFVQPITEERCVAHFMLAGIDKVNTDSDLRLFQHTIVGQDLTILVNHLPRRLPLDPKFEVPTRADAMSTVYRRWLREKEVKYGTYIQPALTAMARKSIYD